MDTLRNIVAQVLRVPIEYVTPETSPQNTPEWDSLHCVFLITEIEKEFAIKLSLKDLSGSLTVQGLFDLIQKGEGTP